MQIKNEQVCLEREALTDVQRNVYEYLCRYISENGVSPSYRDIMNDLEYSSPAPVQSCIDLLEKKGYVSRIPGKARSLKIIGFMSLAEAAQKINELSQELSFLRRVVSYLENLLSQNSIAYTLNVVDESNSEQSIGDDDGAHKDQDSIQRNAA